MRSRLKTWALVLAALFSIGGEAGALGAFVTTAQAAGTYLCIQQLSGQRRFVTGGIAHELTSEGWICTHR